MKPVTITQDDKQCNGFLLVCSRTGSVITRTRLVSKLNDGLAAAVAEVQALFPGREIETYLPKGIRD